MKKIRRIKITVRTKESVVIVKKGTGQNEENPENTQLTICPICRSAIVAALPLPTNNNFKENPNE